MQTEVPFSEALESRFPEQVAIIIARDSTGKYNPMTAGWLMPASLEPPMFAVSVAKSRHTAGAIQSAKCFTIAFPSEIQADMAKLFGTASGRDMDKLQAAGTRTEKARHIDSLLLADAVANFECELAAAHETGDHVVFIGRVVASYLTGSPATRLYTLLRTQHMGGFRQPAS